MQGYMLWFGLCCYVTQWYSYVYEYIFLLLVNNCTLRWYVVLRSSSWGRSWQHPNPVSTFYNAVLSIQPFQRNESLRFRKHDERKTFKYALHVNEGMYLWKYKLRCWKWRGSGAFCLAHGHGRQNVKNFIRKFFYV